MTSEPTIGNEGDDPLLFVRPRILLTGLRRSGKTSIQRVIFTKMQPSQTQFLESTPHLTMSQFSCGSFINFQVQELPGQLHVFPSMNNATDNDGQRVSEAEETAFAAGGGCNISLLLQRSNAVVYVIDAQDDYIESISRLNAIIQLGRVANPKIRYEVFIHKVDQLSEEAKFETQRHIHNQVRDHFAESNGGVDSWPTIANMSNPNAQDILINFHLTSIFDHSIFEAFSKVIQKLLPQFNHLGNLLNHLLSASNIEQAFLFDVQTKISIATDASPSDIQMYELCCDMIDLLINMSEIYGRPNGNASVAVDDDEFIHETQENLVDDELSMTGADQLIDRVYSNDSASDNDQQYPPTIETTNEPASSVFDSMSSSVIKLTGGRALYLKEINRHLALICILREEALSKQAIIDYNVKQLKESILKLFRLDYQTSLSEGPSANFMG